MYTPLLVIAAFGFLIGSMGIARAVEIVPAFPNLAAFDSPINIEFPPDGTDRLFVVERIGQIYVFQNDPGVSQRTVFLDISSAITTMGECGLLGLAFHPDYQVNRYFYVLYVNESPLQTVISRFTASAVNPNLALPGSELPILTIPQNSLFHKGGCIAFGLDGYLYISLGEDGAPALAQSLTTLKGKVLRIDVDNPGGGLQYGIPPDNPFADNPSGYLEEIFAFGFRNPWRFSFDSQTGDLWLGDVGQDEWEEVDVVLSGRNFGWSRMEGNECYQPPSCDTTGLNLVLPVVVYPHDQPSTAASVTGGFVYRGPSIPSLWGKYVFADYINGEVWSLDPDVLPATASLIENTTLNISAFGVDAQGELYFSTFEGPIYGFDDPSTGVTSRPPAKGALGAVYPNPFQSSATIEYTMSTAGRATLDVFDVRGAHVTTLVDKVMPAGFHVAVWDGRDVEGRAQPSGVYYCRLTARWMPAGTTRLVLVK